MASIEDLIQYHNEGEFLDFKREEYNENNKPNLIKDVLSFANADYDKNRYIIMGVAKDREGTIQLYETIAKYDSAHIQQYIHSNIEPNLKIEYAAFKYNNVNLIILTIKAPTEQPYFTKKQVKFKGGDILLNENECFYRNGSFNVKASKKDFDRMYSKNKSFKIDDILIQFQTTQSDTLEISLKELDILPSKRRINEVNYLIDEKYKSVGVAGDDLKSVKDNLYTTATEIAHGYNILPIELEDYTLNQLVTELHEVENGSYLIEDLNFIFEQNSTKLNFNIINKSTEYLRDVTIQLRVKKTKAFFLTDNIYENEDDLDKPNFPLEIENDTEMFFKNSFTSIKHGFSTEILESSLRFVPLEKQDYQIQLEFVVSAENLKYALTQNLYIEIE